MRWGARSLVVVGLVLAGCGDADGAAAPEVERRSLAPLIETASVARARTSAASPELERVAPPEPEPSGRSAEPGLEAGAGTETEAEGAARGAGGAGALARAVGEPVVRPNRTSSSGPAAMPPGGGAVHPDDFPDPFVLRAGSYWYAFSTQRGLTQVPVLRSVDLVHWEERGDALPRLPVWAEFGWVWAPAVLGRGVDGFVLYYATRHSGTGLQCLSRAVSLLPEGPYVDRSLEPLVCQADRGGSIDASPFRSPDGSPWLVWKSEGTLDGEPTRIWSAPLAANGESLAGPAHELLRTEQAWEQPIVEAPSMVLDDGAFHLLYSGNRWETDAYAIGHARCDHPWGPCRRTSPSPVLSSDRWRAGPGGGEVFRDLDGQLLLAHHAWFPTAVGYPAGARRLHIDRLRFDGGRAVVEPRPVTGL